MANQASSLLLYNNIKFLPFFDDVSPGLWIMLYI